MLDPLLCLLGSVLCSVSVAVLLKLAPARRWNVGQLVTWNYLAAALLCFAVLRPSLAGLAAKDAPWASLLVLAVLLPSLFLALARSVAVSGIVRTDVAQRMSLLLSLLAAFAWFGETAGPGRIAGLVLGLLAIAGILVRPDTASSSRYGGGWLVLVWTGFALIDVLLKRVAQAGTSSVATLQVVFVIAFALMALRLAWRWRYRAEPPDWRSLGAGLLLGVLNLGNIFLYVRAHQLLPEHPAVIFAAMNIGVVVAGTLIGVAAFGEKTGWPNRIAIVLAVAAIGLIVAAPGG
ncbi:MAG: EamA family transporter [Xanthomonadaceae bacterium]|nr:EamA family transporter [Xanthomonadaceae bacterium]